MENHFEKIKHWIPEAEWPEFTERMADAVLNGQAFVMTHSCVFLYYSVKSRDQLYGVALYGKENPVDLLALFIGVFGYVDKTAFRMEFKLHPGKEILEYKALLTPVSCKRAASDPNHPLSVRIDQLKKKVCAIDKARKS
ncbi:MAG: hypothetical protein GY820_10525 [Gammaproteobacteria bacterium]|nr:hypothetical protein [Gammaproteobacteria bacterium]